MNSTFWGCVLTFRARGSDLIGHALEGLTFTNTRWWLRWGLCSGPQPGRRLREPLPFLVGRQSLTTSVLSSFPRFIAPAFWNVLSTSYQLSPRWLSKTFVWLSMDTHAAWESLGNKLRNGGAPLCLKRPLQLLLPGTWRIPVLEVHDLISQFL